VWNAVLDMAGGVASMVTMRGTSASSADEVEPVVVDDVRRMRCPSSVCCERCSVGGSGGMFIKECENSWLGGSVCAVRGVGASADDDELSRRTNREPAGSAGGAGGVASGGRVVPISFVSLVVLRVLPRLGSLLKDMSVPWCVCGCGCVEELGA
jgi:hypothetical protein